MNKASGTKRSCANTPLEGTPANKRALAVAKVDGKQKAAIGPIAEPKALSVVTKAKRVALTAVTILDKRWMAMYILLCEYYEKYENTNVSKFYNDDLYRWVRSERQFCKRKDRIDLLDEINFVWDLQG